MVRRRVAYPIYVALIGVLVVSFGLNGGSPAAAAVPAGKGNAATTPTADPTSGARVGPGAVSRPKAAPKVDASPKRVNVADGARPKARAADAAKHAPAGCGGVAMKFGQIYRCPSITGNRQDIFTVTTTVDGDTLYGTFDQDSNGANLDYASAAVYDADSNYLCYFADYPGTCVLGAAGTYTVKVELNWGVGDLDYTFSVQSMKTPSTCRTLGNAFFSFASTGRAGSLVKGSAGDCYVFDQPAGSVLEMYAPHSTGDVRGEILDSDYQPACPVQYDTQCTLTGTAPYHVMMYEFYGNAATYTLRMARISDSVGCPALKAVPFGDPGAATGTGSLAGQSDVACHKLRAPAAGGEDVRLSNDAQIWWTVYDDAGAQVCDKFSSAWSCNLAAAGNYTIITSNQDWNPATYQISATTLYRSAGCSTVKSPAWNQDAAVLTSTSSVQVNCQQFKGMAGQQVVVYSDPSVFQTLVDSAGHALCRDYSDETGCTLPADGTYRAVTYFDDFVPNSTDPSVSYKVQVRSLTAPKGCPVVTPGAFNAPPAGASAPIRCRILRIPGAGTWEARAFDAENYQTYAAVYDVTGHRICDDSSYCTYPSAGDYTMVLDGQTTSTVVDNDFPYVTSLLPMQPAGCPTLSQELYQTSFTDPGQYLCVQLPEPTGASVVELVPGDQTYPFTYVMDSAGNYLCDSRYQLWQTSCVLSGAAPYFAVLSEQSGDAPGPVLARFVRVDGPPSCPALDGSTLTTTATQYVACRSIPADGHSGVESFTWHQTSGTGGASLSVFATDGTRYCGPSGTWSDRTVTCYLPDGPVTVILDASSADATYEISHSPVATS